MFYRIMKFWFTGRDNESYEIMRALTALAVIVMLVYIGFHLFYNKQFDPLNSCLGLGGLLFGGGAGSAIKDGTLSRAAPEGPSTVVTGDINVDKAEVNK